MIGYLLQIGFVLGFIAAEVCPKRVKVWRKKTPKEPTPPPVPDVCNHVWSNWSAPVTTRVEKTTFPGWQMTGEGVTTTATEGLTQERTCDLCKFYERRFVA